MDIKEIKKQLLHDEDFKTQLAMSLVEFLGPKVQPEKPPIDQEFVHQIIDAIPKKELLNIFKEILTFKIYNHQYCELYLFYDLLKIYIGVTNIQGWNRSKISEPFLSGILQQFGFISTNELSKKRIDPIKKTCVKIPKLEFFQHRFYAGFLDKDIISYQSNNDAWIQGLPDGIDIHDYSNFLDYCILLKEEV